MRFAQFGQRFLLEFDFGVIGHRQRFALLRQTLTTAGNDLQRALGVAAIGDFDLQRWSACASAARCD
jgi:hypothetical protein